MNNKVVIKTNFHGYVNATRNSSELFAKYIHQITNFIPLDENKINNIATMSDEEKMEIIIAFNNILSCLLILSE